MSPPPNIYAPPPAKVLGRNTDAYLGDEMAMHDTGGGNTGVDNAGGGHTADLDADNTAGGSSTAELVVHAGRFRLRGAALNSLRGKALQLVMQKYVAFG